ncbi:hypothetical protein BCR34DRAFT_627184 [Clohesyomyces aquaticus]|uniref:Uncharacterized protein n=1 Tax=Clohesyomyces aquaticus TaxID=1231657 RepID=A0A1Y1Z284_9PLEO|nr:hypothetical protein BCR34DRAFT_627184 [Clohesyomyces aquaticus]
MQVPTVTLDDLCSFYAKHFPAAPLPTEFFHGAEEPVHQDQPEEVDLGYYEDGVKRTLTDEDIAFLRRSEIQQILRERRRRRDASQSPERDVSVHSPEPVAPEPSVAQSPLKHPRPASDNTESKSIKDEPSTASTPTTRGSEDRVASGRVEKPKNNWTKSTTERNRRRRQASRRNKRERKLKALKEPEPAVEDESSDEWDPVRQATGPDAIKDTPVVLDY